MLPSHYRSSGGTDADAAASRRAGALLEARKKYGNKNNPQPLGLILLTASCCLVLLFQVCWGLTRPCKRLFVKRCLLGANPAGLAAAATRCHCIMPPLSPCLQLLSCCIPFLAQLWLSGSSSSGRTNGTLADGVTPSQRRVLAAARRGAGAHLGAASRNEARQFPAPHLRNLVLVACHSVYTGLDFTNSEEKSSWFLLDYQKVRLV